MTADMAQMIAQVPVLLETLTGMKMNDLIARLPALREAARQNGASAASSADGTPPK